MAKQKKKSDSKKLTLIVSKQKQPKIALKAGMKLHVVSVKQASILPTRGGIVGDEWSSGTQMESRVLANESFVTEQP